MLIWIGNTKSESELNLIGIHFESELIWIGSIYSEFGLVPFNPNVSSYELAFFSKNKS